MPSRVAEFEISTFFLFVVLFLSVAGKDVEKCFAAVVCSNGTSTEPKWKQIFPPDGCQSSHTVDLEFLRKDFEKMQKRVEELSTIVAKYGKESETLNRTIIQVGDESRQNFLRIPKENYCYMGMKDYSIPNSAINASAEVDYKHGAIFARLDNDYLPTAQYTFNVGAWVAPNRDGQWLQVDLGIPKSVAGVITQGRPIPTTGHKQWVESFRVSSGNDTRMMSTMTSPDGLDQVFSANTDTDGKVVNMFSTSVTARFIRVLPLAYHSNIAMRIELIKGECHGLYQTGKSLLKP